MRFLLLSGCHQECRRLCTPEALIRQRKSFEIAVDCDRVCDVMKANMLHSPPYLFLIRKTAMRYGFHPLQLIQELSIAKLKPSLLCVRGLDSISTLP